MIGKIKSGTNFKGLLKYLDKEDAYIVRSNMIANTPDTLSKEFGLITRNQPKKEKPVFHASLSLAPNDNLNEDDWREITETYLTKMGYEHSQYVCYLHNDTEHSHVHIVANKVNFKGKLVKDSFDYYRSQKILRELEKQYNLTQIPSSWEKLSKSQTTGEKHLLQKNGEKSVRLDLQDTINEVLSTRDNFTMPEFIKELKKVGINPKVKFTRNQKVKGISYEKNGIAFAGNKLGRGFTFPGLQKYHNVSYDASMNDNIMEACNNEVIHKLDTLITESKKEFPINDETTTSESSVGLSQDLQNKITHLTGKILDLAKLTGSGFKQNDELIQYSDSQYEINMNPSDMRVSLSSKDEHGELVSFKVIEDKKKDKEIYIFDKNATITENDINSLQQINSDLERIHREQKLEERKRKLKFQKSQKKASNQMEL